MIGLLLFANPNNLRDELENLGFEIEVTSFEVGSDEELGFTVYRWRAPERDLRWYLERAAMLAAKEGLGIKIREALSELPAGPPGAQSVPTPPDGRLPNPS